MIWIEGDRTPLWVAKQAIQEARAIAEYSDDSDALEGWLMSSHYFNGLTSEMCQLIVQRVMGEQP